jgi:hypothetical protein
MSIITRISTLFPPAPEFRAVNTYQHIDGRVVEYVRGPFTRNEEADFIQKQIGWHEGGTGPTLEMWEAFKGESVCGGCVALKCHRTHKDGAMNQCYTYPATYRIGLQAGYCQSCYDRESIKIKEKHERDMAYMAETIRKPVIESAKVKGGAE